MIDPNIDPGDYDWRGCDADISIVFYAKVTTVYLIKLVLQLLLAKADSIQFLDPVQQSAQVGVVV